MQSQLPELLTKKLSEDKIQKVIEVAGRLNINPAWLLAVMYFESAKTFSPSVRNGIGSVGLIQFTRDKAGVDYKTIAGKKYYLNDLAKMSFIQQMDVVEAYYKEASGGKKLNSFIDVYLVTFFPAALGKPDDYAFATKGLSASLIAKQNPLFDRDKNEVIHKREVTDYFRELYTQWGFDFDREINVKEVATSTPVLAIVAVFFYTCYTAFICI